MALINPNGTLNSRFVYGSKFHSPDYVIKGSTKYSIVHDHLGSPVMIVNSSTGAVSQQISYDEWGNILSDTSPGFIPFGFGGCLYDVDTKLCRFGVRDYDPSIGRWLSKDPVLFKGKDTNLYGYVLQDPINLIDPKGTWPEWLDDGLCGISGKCDPSDIDSPDFTDTLGDLLDDVLDKPKMPNPPGSPGGGEPTNSCEN